MGQRIRPGQSGTELLWMHTRMAMTKPWDTYCNYNGRAWADRPLMSSAHATSDCSALELLDVCIPCAAAGAGSLLPRKLGQLRQLRPPAPSSPSAAEAFLLADGICLASSRETKKTRPHHP